MNPANEKCVVILDESLPLGVIANTAAILGVTMGMKMPGVVGCDVCDGAGRPHAGIIQFPIPILKGNPEILRELRAKLFEPPFSDLAVVDFTDLAQGCRTYGDFIGKMSACPPEDLQYMGIAVCGEKKKVAKLTGNLPLLR